MTPARDEGKPVTKDKKRPGARPGPKTDAAKPRASGTSTKSSAGTVGAPRSSSAKSATKSSASAAKPSSKSSAGGVSAPKPSSKSSAGAVSASKSSAGAVSASKSSAGAVTASKSTSKTAAGATPAESPSTSERADKPAKPRPAARRSVRPPPPPAKAIDAPEPTSERPAPPKKPKERVAARSPLRTPAAGVPIPAPPARTIELEDVEREDVQREAVEREEPSEPEFAFGDGDAMLGAIPDFVSAKERVRSPEIMVDFAPEPASEVASFTDRPPPPARAERSIEETIEDLHRAAHEEGDPGARQRAAQAFADIAERLGGSVDAHTQGSTGRLRTGDVEVHDVDDFGLDRAYEARMRGLVDGLYDRWFRVMVRGAEHVPTAGPALVVANHGGVLPWDGLMLRTAIAREIAPRAPGRELRWLVEDSLFHAPFIGATANRLGAIRACPENAERLLSDGNLIAVFPEGDKGISKPFGRRYELQRFGRGGYVKLALRMRTPIVPTAIIGAEEAHPMMFSTQRIAKLFGLSYLPVTATFPWLGPLGLLPLPSRWVILFGEPIDVSGEPASAAEDEVLVSRINDEVREAVQALLRKALSLRPQPYGWSR